MKNFLLSNGFGGAKIELSFNESGVSGVITYYIPRTDSWSPVMPETEISFEKVVEEASLDELMPHVVHPELGGRFYYSPRGWQNGQHFIVETGEEVKEGIYRTTTSCVGEPEPHSMILYYDGQSKWFRVINPEQIILDVAEEIASHQLVDPKFRGLRSVELPNGRGATSDQIKTGANLVLQRQREGATALVRLLGR